MSSDLFINGENTKKSTTILDSIHPAAPSLNVLNGKPGFETVFSEIVQSNNAMELLFASDPGPLFLPDENHERIRKFYWISEYTKDIYNSLRESEVNRYVIHFQSPQIEYRPNLLELLKSASRKHKLGRSTLHLAVYLVDCFMDHYSIRNSDLKLIAISFLLVAAKMEETDGNLPKFAELNKLTDDQYYLCEFKNMERKILQLFNFNLTRPTIVTFAELFSSSIITVDDCCRLNITNYVQNDMTFSLLPPPILNIGQQCNVYEQYKIRATENIPQQFMSDILNYSPGGNYYVELRTSLIKAFFELVDLTLMHHNFVNLKPSMLASACVAAARRIYGIHPIWNQHLINLTEYTIDVIIPFVEAILAIYHLRKNKSEMQLRTPQTTTIASMNTNNGGSTYCDSPDSGIALSNDTKEYSFDNDSYPINFLKIESHNNDENNADINNDNDESYYCLEYPLLAKRRRIQ